MRVHKKALLKDVGGIHKKVRTSSIGCKGKEGGDAKKANQSDMIPKEYKTEIIYEESTKTFYIYLLGQVTEPSDYTNVLTTFNTAREDETIRCYISGPGGRKDTADIIRHAALNSEALTVAIIGDCASADTIIPLAFDELEVMPNIEFMIHNYSSWVGGKHHEILSQADFLKAEMPEVFRRYYQDFLTYEEATIVINGGDIYLNSEQVTERWKNVQAAREAEFDAYMAEANKDIIQTHISELNRLGIKIQIPSEEEPKKKAKSKTTK